MKEKIEILIVEDEKSVRGLYSIMLDLINCTYRMAESYGEAIDLLEKYEFRVCILDVNLKEKEFNGVELAIKLKNETSIEKIFVVTGYGHIFDEYDSNIAGIDKVFNKPDGFRPLIKEIKEYLGK
jgi:DNA-binding NtrC family response regulator